jgi:hypothetical protein
MKGHMRRSDERSIVLPHDRAALVVACGCSASELADAVLRWSSSAIADWIVVADGKALETEGSAGFKAVVDIGSGPKNNERAIARVMTHTPSIGATVLVIGEGVALDEAYDSAFFCANLPSTARYVAAAGTLLPLAKFINIECRATEQEWMESDASSITCTLYGNIGRDQSGLHSLFLGRQAYERFIDSYYLEDMLKIRYHGHRPEKFYYMLYFALLWFHRRGGRSNMTELGATMWSTIDKIAYCHQHLGLTLRLEDVEWISIELSDYLRRLSHILHAELDLTFFDRWQSFHRSDAQVGFSHVVTPYAFHDESDVASWLKKFGFCLWVSDFTLKATRHWRVNGKSWTVLSLQSMLMRLQAQGMKVVFVDGQNLDPEGQIKRTALIVYDESRFDFGDYLQSLALAGDDSVIAASDFRPFDFEPKNLWDKIVDDEAYFDQCAHDFSVGFAGALALSRTGPYELRWYPPQVQERVGEYLRTYGSTAEAR